MPEKKPTKREQAKEFIRSIEGEAVEFSAASRPQAPFGGEAADSAESEAPPPPISRDTESRLADTESKDTS